MTYTAQQLVNHILERMIFRFQPEPIIPCERITGNEAGEDVVIAHDTDDAEDEKGEGDAECKKVLVVYQSGRQL